MAFVAGIGLFLLAILLFVAQVFGVMIFLGAFAHEVGNLDFAIGFTPTVFLVLAVSLATSKANFNNN